MVWLRSIKYKVPGLFSRMRSMMLKTKNSAIVLCMIAWYIQNAHAAAPASMKKKQDL